jgi:hypothetical protein
VDLLTFFSVANAIETAPKQLATHLALTALSSFATKQQPNAPLTPTMDALTSEALALLPPGTELPEDFEAAVGEVYVSFCPSDIPYLCSNVLTHSQCPCTHGRPTEHSGAARWCRRTGGHQDDHKTIHTYQWLVYHRPHRDLDRRFVELWPVQIFLDEMDGWMDSCQSSSIDSGEIINLRTQIHFVVVT